jgi:hypothetical protein
MNCGMAKRLGLLSVAVGAMAITPLAIWSCRKSDAGSSERKPANIVVHEYTTRAIVALIPNSENPTAAFTARHEPIPHFMGENGALGMPAMEMPFPLKPGVSLDGIKLGNKIELTFEVEYDAALKRPAAYAVTKIARLPDDTRLNFAPPPAGSTPAHQH